MDALYPAILAIGGLGLLPLVITIIGAIARARANRRREAMFRRFNDRIGA